MPQAENGLYAGIDLHKHYAFVTVMDQQGYIKQQRRYENKESRLTESLTALGVPVQATVESSYGWYWLADQLEASNIPFVLAHPQKIKAIAGKKKTDREDSRILADLLRTNLLPMSYVPTRLERDVKEILRFRMQLVQQRSTYKRRLHDVLDKQNIHCPFSDILGKGSQAWLLNLDCPEPYQSEIRTLVDLSHQVAEKIRQYDGLVREQASEDPNVALLKTIPGIGDVLALTLSVEIGDVKRFKDARALSSYAGVVPSVSSSGDKTHHGSVGHSGNKYIRWALAESLMHVTREGRPLYSFYQGLKVRKGAPKARVAVMNKLLRSIYAMLSKRVVYELPQINTQCD